MIDTYRRTFLVMLRWLFVKELGLDEGAERALLLVLNGHLEGRK
jgi:hypothetical protein